MEQIWACLFKILKKKCFLKTTNFIRKTVFLTNNSKQTDNSYMMNKIYGNTFKHTHLPQKVSYMETLLKLSGTIHSYLFLLFNRSIFIEEDQ